MTNKSTNGYATRSKSIKMNIKGPKIVIVPPSNWRFGYDSNSNANSRIIVTFKDENGIWERNFDKESDTTYYCVGCTQNKRIKNYASYINDTFHSPTFHDCPKICAKKNELNQKKKEKKFLDKTSNKKSAKTLKLREKKNVLIQKMKAKKSKKIPSVADLRRQHALEQQKKENEKKQLFERIKNSPNPFTFANPRRQNFSLPTPIVRYLIRSENHSQQSYDKLVKTCKWVYFRNRIILSEDIIVTQIDQDIVMIEGEPLHWNI